MCSRSHPIRIFRETGSTDFFTVSLIILPAVTGSFISPLPSPEHPPEDDFVDLYYLKEDISIDKIKIQQDEVEDVKWADKGEIENMIENGQFSESHTEFFEDCLEYLKLN